MEFKKNIELKLEITPEEAADIFSGMNDKEQALFFNQVGRNFTNWGPGASCFQIHGFTTSKLLDHHGVSFLRLVSDYAPDPIQTPTE